MRTSIILIVTLLSLVSNAQNFDFGKVSKEEVEEKYNPQDSSASATYLYKYRRTYIEYNKTEGFQMVTEIQERLKIYNKEGFDYATTEIDLYKSGSDNEKLTSLKGYTYNLVDGKLEETKLEKDGIFKNEESKYRDQTKFTMPKIKEGSVIEYKYTVISPFFWNVDDFVFQDAIPIKKLDASFETPEYYVFKAVSKGFLPINPKTETKNDKIIFSNSTRTQISVHGSTAGGVSYSELNFLKTITSYNLSDIPALKDEPFVNNINNYRSAVKYELSYTKFPDSPLKYFSTTWEDVVKTIYESSSFDVELEKTGYFEDDVNAMINSISDPIARAALIYNHVKSRMRWNGYYGKYTDGGVKKAYKDQVGNVAEINLMLTAMLRHAGLNANPVLVSSRHNGVPMFPTLDGYNYVISAIEMPEGTILLDATNKYGSPNILPFRALNWEGRIIRKNKSSSTISLYPKDKSKETISLIASLKDNGDIEGGVRTMKTNHDALVYRERYLETDKKQFLEAIENKHKGIEIDGFEVLNDVDISKPVIESYKFSLESQADIIANKLYLSPMLFLKIKENPFKLEKREFPVDFGYPSSTRYMINIDIPSGYQVESIPAPLMMALPDNLGGFKYNISASETKIQLVIDVEINESIISPVYYDAIKQYFSKIVEKEAEQLVLTKV